MLLVTREQREAAEKLLKGAGGSVHVVLIHDSGTSQRVIKPSGNYDVVDVDDFYPDSNENLGEIIMDRLRCNPTNEKDLSSIVTAFEQAIGRTRP